MDGGNKSPTFDWDGFKQKQFAVICETDKERFFADCKAHGICCFVGEFEKTRDMFICCKLFESPFNTGRYELFSLDGWEIKPNKLYGKDGLQEVKYE